MLAVSTLAITKRVRTHKHPEAAQTVYYNYGWRYYARLSFFADLSWVNTSNENHWIEITVEGRDDGYDENDTLGTTVRKQTISRPRDAVSASKVRLTTWAAKSNSLDLTRTITITVKATNGVISSTLLSVDHVLDLSETVTEFLPPRDSGQGELILPEIPDIGEYTPPIASCTNALEAANYNRDTDQDYLWLTRFQLQGEITNCGYVVIEPLGVTPSFRGIDLINDSGAYTGMKKRLLIRNIPPHTPKLTRDFLSKFLIDGGFYSVKVFWPKPKPLTSADVISGAGPYWPTTFDKLVDVAAFSTNIEYWKTGKKTPVITSPLSITAYVSTPWAYQIKATGALSYDSNLNALAIPYATQQAVDTETGELSGLFLIAGEYDLIISATNEVGTTSATAKLTISAFEAFDVTANVKANVESEVRLKASHQFYGPGAHGFPMDLVSGSLPPGMQISWVTYQESPTQLAQYAAIVGTPSVKGSYSCVLLAGKAGIAGVTDTCNVTITVSANGEPPPPSVETELTVIVPPSNASGYTSTESLTVGEQFRAGFVSKPAIADWKATGLPPGITINATTGLVEGTVTTPGRYSALITAKAAGYLTSLPVLIVASVDPLGDTGGGGTGGGGTGTDALNRLPWLADEWKYIDIQVGARTREVKSTMDTENGIRLKAGDDLNFLIFFMDAKGDPFKFPITRLRLTIREANNLDDPLVLEAEDAPYVLGIYPAPCFALVSAANDTGRSDMRDIVEGWVANSAKAAQAAIALPCTGDVEWEIDGQSFSSDAFRVVVELDVTR